MTFDRRASARLACGALAAALLCSASTVALAAPNRTPRSPAVTQEQLQQVLDELRAEREARQAAESRIEALTERLGTLESATQVIQTQSATVGDLATQVEVLNSQPTVAVGNGRPTFATRDGAFSASLRAVVMVDSAYYNQETPGPLNTDWRRGAGAGDTARARDLNSGTLFRRARLGIEGRVFKDFTYNLITEFGGSGTEDAGRIYEMWIQYNGIPNWAIRAGAFEPQNGLGSNVSTSNIMIMERPSVAEITRNIAGGDTRTAIQVQHWSEFGNDSGFGGSWMAAAAFTGSAPSTLNTAGGFASQAFGEQRSATGRFVIAPSPSPDLMFHVGVNGSYVFSPADTLGPDNNGINPAGSTPVQFRDRPELRVDGTRLIDTGGIDADHAWHWGLEGSLQYASFMIEGEYQRFGIDRRNSVLSDPRFSGWYVEGSWVITGEKRRYQLQNGVYDAPAINNPWQPGSGGYGAFELAARYSVADLNYHEGLPNQATPADGIRGGEQRIWTLGLNWYVNNNIRFMLDYLHVDIDRLAPSANFGGTASAPNPATGVPLGGQIGQDYDAIALRAQFGF